MKVSKNGAAEANHGGTLTELASGRYSYEFSSGEVDTVGFLSFALVKSGIRAFVTDVQIVAFDPYDAAGFGLSRLDAAITTRASQASVDVVDDFLDTEVAAIKAKTDNLPTDPADESLIEAAIAAVQADTDNIQTRLPAALVGGRIDASVGAMAADVVTAAAIAAGAIGVSEAPNLDAAISTRASAANLATVQSDTDDIQARLPAALVGGRIAANAEVVGDKTGYTLAAAEYTALVNLIWNELTSEGRTAGSFGQLLKDNLNAAVSSRAVPGDAMDLIADAVDAVALADAACAEIADKILGRSIAGAADGGRTVRSALRRVRNRVAIAAGTMTVYAEDDATPDHTAAVTTTAGNPISEVDPV